MQAAYGDTSSYIAGLARQAAMFVQQTSHSIQEDAPCPEQLEQEATHPSDAWVEVTKPLQFLVVESQVCSHINLLDQNNWSFTLTESRTEGKECLIVICRYLGPVFVVLNTESLAVRLLTAVHEVTHNVLVSVCTLSLMHRRCTE